MGFSKQDVKNIYPLTPIQEGMLFHALKEKDSSAYFQQTSWRISGHFDRDVFDAAWLKLVQRHDIMRTLFTYEHSDKPLQVVLKAVSFKVEHIDLLDHDFEQRENLCEYYRTADRLQSFQLDHAPLMRVSVLHLAHDQWEIIWSHHHILMDGWSYGILLQEFMLLYQRKLNIELPPAPSFSNYVKWLSHKPLPAALAYWKAHLEGYEQCIEIPFKRFPSPKTQTFDEVNFSLSPENHDRLTRLTREGSLTLNSVLQGLVALLLSRYCDVDDLVFGTVVSGRPPDLQQIENMVGNFINTIPTRVKIDWNATALEFLKNIQYDQLQSTEYQFCPLSQIQGSTDVKGDLFNVVMAVENYPLDEMVSTAATREQIGFGIDRVFSFDKTHYDFDIQFVPSGDGSLNAKIIFDSAKYDAKYINNIPALFEVVVEALCDNPQVPLKDNLLLSAMDQQAVLHDFINTSAQHTKPGPDTLVHRFALQVAATPDAAAVKDDQHELSYRELDQRSNQVANHLINLGIEPEQPVALCTGRSINLLVAMLGILKSGGAYLPMDLSQPMARLSMQAKDASVRFILSDHTIAPDSSLDELLLVCQENHNNEELCGIKGAQNQSVHCILLEDVYDLPVSTPNPVSDHHNSGQIRENQLAYIIYTSGSTGIPKGTLVEHHSVVNLVDAIDETILRPYSSPVCIALLANTVFDASVQQIFSTLLLGHCLYVVDPESKRDPALLLQKFKTHEVVLSDCTPSLLGLMLSQDSADFDSLSLELLITGGEALSLELVQRFYEKSSRINLINVYGPTECCVDVTAYRLTRDCLPDASVIPLGKPLRNTQLFVLAANGTPAPVGVPGEIYIAGSGLSRGYLNRPEQDQLKFVNLPRLSPFKLYRTGDLGRWSLDGNLEYLGRLDAQIKLKGFRIEPGEIEHRLLQHPSVLNTVVMVNGQQLIAYVVFRSGMNAPDRTALLDFLAETLPDYMVPHHLYVLDEIPLTPSGKVDRKHLPSPETLHTVASGTAVMPPVTLEERVLVETLGEVLGNGNISIDDNYFALGGDSIKAIQTISKLHRKGFHLEVKSLFKTPVLKTLANLLTPLLAEKGALPVLNEQILSPIQKRFMNNHGARLNQFNHALLFFPLNGGSEQPEFTTDKAGRYDSDKLKEALQAVFNQHRSLSLKFAENTQLNSKRKLSWQHHDLRRDPEGHTHLSEIGEQVQAEFDINTGKVFSANLFTLPEGDRLLLSAHHLVIDAVSWQILIADLEDHYQSLLRGNPVQTQRSPAAQTPGWLDWIEATKRFASSKAILKDIQYWAALEAEVEQAQTSAYQNAANQKQSPSPCLATHLQFTSPYGAVQTEQLELSEQLTSQLLREANQAYGTNTQDLLVSGVVLALYEYTAMPALLLELESHGRDIFNTDPSDTKGIDSAAVTGWFTNVWPVLLRITQNRDLGYQIKTIKEQFRKVPHQGASYGLLENFGPKEFVKPLSFSLKPAISFNYLGEIATQNRAQHFQLSTRGQDAYFIDPKTVVSPDAKRPCPIELSALVQEGKLNLEIRFDPDWNKQYWPEFNPMLFLDYWLQQLDNVTANCLAQHQRDITPSDLSYSDISLEELEGIIS